MWNRLMDLLPDLTVGTFEIRDLLNLTVAGLATYLAWLAIRMGQRQEELSKQQGEISKRQAEITERQHQILEEQLSKKPDLRIRAGNQSRQGSFGPDGDLEPTVITLRVHNGGNKSSEGFYWEVLVARGLINAVSFCDLEDEPIKAKFTPFSETEIYDKVDGYYDRKLYPYTQVGIVKMLVRPSHKATEQFVIKWRIRAEEGPVPTDGLAEIGFKRQQDRMFAVSHPVPGEKVDPTAVVVQQGSEV